MHVLKHMSETVATYTDLPTQEPGLSECQCLGIQFFFVGGEHFSYDVSDKKEGNRGGLTRNKTHQLKLHHQKLWQFSHVL